MTHLKKNPPRSKRHSSRISPSLAERLDRHRAAGERNWKRTIVAWMLSIAIWLLP